MGSTGSTLPRPNPVSQIQCGDFINYTTNVSHDLHYYSFSLADNGDYGYGYSVVIDTCGSEFDTVVYLYEDNGTHIDLYEENDDSGWCGVSSEIAVDSLYAGDYMIGLDGFSDYHYGRYQLDLTCSSATEPTPSGSPTPQPFDYTINSGFYGFWEAYASYDAAEDPDAQNDENYAFISSYYFEWWNSGEYHDYYNWIVNEEDDFYLDESRNVRVQLMNNYDPAILKVSFDSGRFPNPFIYYYEPGEGLSHYSEYQLPQEDEELVNSQSETVESSSECDSFYFGDLSYLAFPINVCIVRDHAPITQSVKGLCNADGEVELYVYDNLECSGTESVESPCYFHGDSDCDYTSKCNLGPCGYTSYQHWSGVTQCDHPIAYGNYTKFPLVHGGCGSVEDVYGVRVLCNSELNSVSMQEFTSTDCSGDPVWTETILDTSCEVGDGEASIVECGLTAAVPAPNTAAAVSLAISPISIYIILHFVVVLF
eukprot:179144_1